MNVCVVRICVSFVLSHLYVSCKQTENNTEITIVPTTKTQSSSSPSSSIKCVSPNVVASSNSSYVVIEAIYYENGSNGVQNHSNQLVLAKVKNNPVSSDANVMIGHNAAVTKTETSVAPPILVTSVSTPLTSVLQCTSATSSNHCAIVKKPGIILLTPASLSKLLGANDLNVINNNSNQNTVNHAHSHQNDNNIRSKCNIAITNQNPTQNNNNQLTSVLMINSTSTIETSAGVVTLTASSGTVANPQCRDATEENGKHASQQVNNVFVMVNLIWID